MHVTSGYLGWRVLKFSDYSFDKNILSLPTSAMPVTPFLMYYFILLTNLRDLYSLDDTEPLKNLLNLEKTYS